MKMTTAERNELDRQLWIGTEYDHNFGMGWDEEAVLTVMRSHCTVTEQYEPIAHDDGTIERITTLQFHDRQDLIDFFECEMKLKEEIDTNYRISAHIDTMTILVKRWVKFLNNVDAIKEYFDEGDEEE
jgi:hypothetical protein